MSFIKIAAFKNDLTGGAVTFYFYDAGFIENICVLRSNRNGKQNPLFIFLIRLTAKCGELVSTFNMHNVLFDNNSFFHATKYVGWSVICLRRAITTRLAGFRDDNLRYSPRTA